MEEDKISDSQLFHKNNNIMTSIGETLWIKRTGVERRLIVSVALVAVACLVLFILLMCNLHKEALPELLILPASTTAVEVCNTTICRKQASVILSAIDQSLDPCDDFYEFTCGNWERTNHIPEDAAQYSTFHRMEAQLAHDLKDIFENTPYDTKRQNTSDKVIMMYRSCLNDTQSDEAQAEMFRRLLASLGIPEWPLRENPPSNDVLDYDCFSKLYTETFTVAIFAIGPFEDPENVTNKVLVILPAPTGLDRQVLLTATDPEDTPVQEAYKTYMSESIKFLDPRIKPNELNATVDAIVNFERHLTIAAQSAKGPQGISFPSDKRSVAQLETEVPEIDWLRLIDTIFHTANITVDEKETVYSDLHYLKSTVELLKTVDKKTVYNYLGWRMIQTIAPSTSNKFRELAFNFNSVVTGTRKMSPLWENCISAIRENAQMPVARLYVERKFNARNKQDMEDLVSDVRESLATLFKENEWMDEKTKKEAFKKLKMMAINIGYPESIMNDTYLNSHYKVPDFKPGDLFLDAILKFRRVKLSNDLRHLRTSSSNNKEWEVSPVTVNAFNALSDNAIYFPAGILQFPTYSYGVPVNINMGTIGVTIGHEITHGFDGQGRTHDEKGNSRNWWTNETAAEFKRRAQCIVDQYNRTFDPQANMTLNGVKTQNEDIPDNGAIREAFRAQRIAIARTGALTAPALPGLEKYDSDQMFFIAMGVQWCTLTRTEELKHAIQTDTHSPAKYRINIPSMNFEQFAKSFHCPKGSRMNPTHRCVVW